MPKYLTVTEMRNFRPPRTAAKPDWTSWEDDELSAFIDDYEAQLEELTNSIFGKETKTITVSGRGEEKLFPKDFGMPYPIISVTSADCVDFGGVFVESFRHSIDFFFDPNTPYYLIWNNASKRSIRERVSAFSEGSGWPEGQRNIKLTLEVGMETTPLVVKKALKLWITAEALGKAAAGFTEDTGESGKVQEVWEDYTVTYSKGGKSEERKNKGVPNLTGYLDIDKMLSPYVNYAGLFNKV